MKTISRIISEEIHKFLVCESQGISYGSFNEEDKTEKKESKRGYNKEIEEPNTPQEKHTSEYSKMIQRRKEKANRRDGKEVSSSEAAQVRDFLNDPSVNVSEVMVQATGLAPTSASSLGAKIAKGKRPVKNKLSQVVKRIQNNIS